MKRWLACLAGLAIAGLSPAWGDADYFPPHFVTAFERAWYVGALEGAGEPSLYRLSHHDSKAVVYRVTVLTAFGDNYFMRLEVRPDHSGVLTLTKAGLHAGPIKRWEKVLLRPSGVRHFEALLDATNFWQLAPNSSEDLINDASEIICEAVRGGQYHVTQREDDPRKPAASKPAYFLMGLLNEPTDNL